MILLILTVCALNAPSECNETRLEFVDEGSSLMQCTMRAPPTIALWCEQHPGVWVARWRCAFATSEGQKT